MVRIEKSIEIRAPPEKVWEMLAQDRHLEWLVGGFTYKSVEYTSEVHTPEDKYSVGASAHVIAAHDEFDITITESLENQEIAYSLQVKGARNAFQTYTLKPTEAGTELIHQAMYEVSNLIIRMLDKLVVRMFEKDFIFSWPICHLML